MLSRYSLEVYLVQKSHCRYTQTLNAAVVAGKGMRKMAGAELRTPLDVTLGLARSFHMVTVHSNLLQAHSSKDLVWAFMMAYLA